MLQLRALQSTLTPSELDGINELKELFLRAHEGKTLAALEAEVFEIDAQVLAFGDGLTELRAELELLLARFLAVREARNARLFAARAGWLVLSGVP